MKYKEITTIEAVHAALKLDMKCLADVSMLPADEAKDTINSILYKRMIKAINLDDDGSVYEPNWNDGSRKIQGWHEIQASDEQPGGFAFSLSSCADWRSNTAVGSRLLFRDTPRYWHALEHFKPLFIADTLILK